MLPQTATPNAALDPPAPDAAPWYAMDAAEVARALDTGPAGLDASAVAARQRQYGPNEIEVEQIDPWWLLAMRQFRDPFIYILLLAAGITAALGEFTDSIVILLVVVTNAIVGFVQELRAREAMRALEHLTAPLAEVIRGGADSVVPARELVPGDLVLLASGARVPADLRLTEVRDLDVDESALTGESLPVRKRAEPVAGSALVAGDQLDMAFSGTTVTRGRARGLVVRIGGATELGRIAESMRGVGQTLTPLQRRMARFGRQLGILVAILAAVVAAIGAARGMPFGEIFSTAVAVAVSAIPEGLPVVLTVTLAIGVHRMSRRRAIIRSLPTVETLGSTTVIGSDKTGTLTKNEMTVREVWTPDGAFTVTGVGYALAGAIQPHEGGEPTPVALQALEQVLLAATLANEADPGAAEREQPTGDPTEIALHVAASKAGIAPVAARSGHPELDMLPFEPERRFMATINRDGAPGGVRVSEDVTTGGMRLWMKGAPEVVLGRCDTMRAGSGAGPLDAQHVRDAAATMAARGLRVLAMATAAVDSPRIGDAPLDHGAVLLGLVGMEDPVRPEAQVAVTDAQAAGIRVIMLTGDHVETARAIGAQLGLDGAGGTLSGHDLQSLSDAELDAAVRTTSVFARVAPEHKLRIVQRLAAQGEIVAVTGDGVNDAPALRAAHIGIAMGSSGTDVAREAADMVLADDNFATITAAVEEGRIVFANIRKVTFFLLSTAVGEVLTILVALLAGWPLPFVAAQILWINLVTNGLQDVALAFEPGEPGLLRQRPRPADEGVLTRRLTGRLGGVGLVLAAGSLGMFWWTWQTTDDLDLARTAAMTQMVVFQFFHVFNCRSLDRSIVRIPLFSNPFLFASIAAAAAAHLAVLHVPLLQGVFRTVALTGEQWLLIGIVATSVIAGGELDKLRNRRRHRPIG